jgi:16S rRNA (guanine1516-N2)-methyltransferase
LAHSPARVSVAFEGEALRGEATVLAARLGLALAEGPDDAPLHLNVTAVGLSLSLTGKDAPGPIRVDFVAGRLGYRQAHTSLRREPLARAVGLKGHEHPTVVDATAGLGRDAFVLATLGCRVTLVEREPVIAALLDDGLARAAREPALADTVARLHWVRADARDYLSGLPQVQRPEVVYMDPMYPQRDKSALVKKEMRVFRALVGDDEDAPGILEVALEVAKRRVVVKRPARAAPLGGHEPSHRIPGKTTRFDVYLTGR